MGRYFSFSSTNTWSGDIKVRLYFTTAELNSLISASHTGSTAPNSDPNGCEDDDDVNTITDIVATKYVTGSGPGGAGGTFLSQQANGFDYDFNAHYVDFNVNGFSDIYLHGSEHNVALPVELLTFSAQPIDNKYVSIEWETATEINNDGFELLRSTNGIDFEKITWINGNGNTSNKQSYSYNDYKISNGTYYYKLRQVDFDGEFEEFYVVSATINKDHSNATISIRPIPTSNTITIDVNSYSNEKTLILVYNYAGKKVLGIRKELREGNNNLIIEEVVDLPSGIYYLDMTVNNKTYTEKFVIVK